MALVWLALAWLLGVGVAAFTSANLLALVAVVSLGTAVAFAARPQWSTLVVAALGAVLLFAGEMRYEATVPNPDTPLARLNDTGPLRLRAVVSDEPDERTTTRLYRLEAREVQRDGRWFELRGGIMMTAPIFPAYEYGDLLELEGELEYPPEFPDFNYRDYLLRRGITSTMSFPDTELVATGQGSAVRAELIGVRGDLSEALSEVLPEPEASLAAGILYGAKSAMPTELRDDLNTTGTSHLVAVSGQNITIVAGLVIAALAWLVGRRPAAWLALLAISGYVALVGLEPSVIRAWIMACVYVTAILVGRQNTAWVALAVAAAIMTAIDPQTVHEVAFQLSFAAALGLTTLATPLRDRVLGGLRRSPTLAASRLTRPAAEIAVVTAVAILFTLPITALTFGSISLVAFPANMLAVPAFVVVAATSGVAALVTLAVPHSSDVMAWIAWPPAAYMVWVVETFAALPGASVTVGGLRGELALVVAVVWYGALGILTWRLMREPAQQEVLPVVRAPGLRVATALGFAVVVALALGSVWLATTRDDDGRLTVTFLDVGQGDAILIEGPRGHRVLVDGGPGGQAIAPALGRTLPFDDRRIDLVVATHADADHIGGLPEVLAAYDVAAVLETTDAAETGVYSAWRDAVTAADIPVRTPDRGQLIDLGRGARIEVLGPNADDPLLPITEGNDASVVLRVSMGKAVFLLTGDIGEAGESALVRSGVGLDATVLKVAHHGSRTSSGEAFLSRVDPLIDVISVGASNPHGHPSEETLARLVGDLVLRTDEHGDVAVSTDGTRLWVSTSR